jgi:hypothetical protein
LGLDKIRSVFGGGDGMILVGISWYNVGWCWIFMCRN